MNLEIIFVKGYRFLSFAKNMSKITSKNVSSKYSAITSADKLLDNAKESGATKG